MDPTVLVTRCLRDTSSITHASRLAERTTIESSLYPTTNSSNDDNNDGTHHPLAKMVLARSTCPQPPLDDGITGGGSSVSCDMHFSGINTRLDPLERCAPHHIVDPRGELDGTYYNDTQLCEEQKSATWNAITALATLCDEVQELDLTFQTQLLPSIVLFSSDDEDTTKFKSKSAEEESKQKKNSLDEEAQEKRESALLSRIGKFVPTLQLTSNGTSRLRRLVRNMVMQLGAVKTPSAIPFYYDDEHPEDVSGVGTASGNQNGVNNNNMANVGEENLTQPPVFGLGVPLFRLGKAIATALRILVAVDSAISTNTDLLEAWAMYKDVVMELSEQKRTDNSLDDKFESFERMMVQLDFNLLSSRSFITAIEQNFDSHGRFQAAKFPLWDEVKSILATLYGQYCERINTEQEVKERLDAVGVYAMYVLYRHLLPPNVVPDPKLHKSLWSVFPAMCPIMELFGPIHFLPREFMMTYTSYKGLKGCSADIPEIRSAVASMVVKWDGSFKARVAKIRINALGWLARADSELSPIVPVNDDNDDDFDDEAILASLTSIETATSCILRGIQILHSASILLRSHLLTHRVFGLAYDHEHISCLVSLIEVVKSIEKMLRVRRRSAVLSFQRSTLKMIAQNILKCFDKIRSFVDQCSSSMDFSHDSDRARSITRVSACLTALEGVLKGTSSFSPIRRHAISFSVAACMDTTILEVFTTEDLRKVEGHLRSLSEVASIEETLNQACDCCFLYHYRDLFPDLVRNLYETNLKSGLSRDQLVLSALSDPLKLLNRVQHAERDQISGVTNCYTSYQNFVRAVLKEEYSGPICEMIETDLRIACTGDSKGVNNVCLRKFVTSPPLYVCQMRVYVKSDVENYLEKTFFDQCALNLNDCNTYNQMRSIANERYGLNLTDPFLPDGSLEQESVDFLDILRDLDSFISQYNYNLIEQSFIERKPKPGAKTLSMMNIETVAASLRQHGLGVVSSAVNLCYKLLASKFQFFTEFMSNDSIKSLLSRELRWFDSYKNEGNLGYPFDRATAFAREFKKLQDDSDNNRLDECRVIISEMGNVIALARMIRAAKRRLFSNEVPFLSEPSVTSNDSRSFRKEDANNAQSDVDDALSSILDMPDTDFVRAFANVFRGEIIKKSQEAECSDKLIMGIFFCVVPALCLCWMEHMVQGKEMMHKTSITRDGYYTDDGYAVGLAFTLSSLGQTMQYDSLNWFKSIQIKYADEEEGLMEKKNAHLVKRNAKIGAAKAQNSWFSSSATENKNQEDDDDEMKILNLMSKRLEGNRREMAMLFFTLQGARSFFKDNKSM